MSDDNIIIRYENGRKIVEVASIGGDYDTTVMKAMEMASRTGAQYRQSDVADRRLGSEMASSNRQEATHYREQADEIARKIEREPDNFALKLQKINAEADARLYEDWASQCERMARG